MQEGIYEMHMSQRERMETELIQSLITSYFNVVRKNIQDSIPKAIMFLLVNHVKNVLQSYLIQNIYSRDKVDELMSENAELARKREEVANMVKALQDAQRVIKTISF